MSDSETTAGTRPFLVTLKPNHFPNHASVSRFLDGFNVLSPRSEAGRLWMKTITKNTEHAHLLRYNSGEYLDGGAGTSIQIRLP
jgi:hypothetical protein